MLNQLPLIKPIIQAPMAGITTPSFVAACCEAGILGSIGAGYLNGEQTLAQIRELKQLTDKPFQVNVFVQEEPKIDIFLLQDARMALQPIYEELGISDMQKVTSVDVFSGQIEAIIEEQVPIVSFTFGLPSKDVLQRVKAYGATVIGTATTVEEALAVQAHGFDAVVLQGSEAGGHRGSFLEPMQLVPIRQLLMDVEGKLSIPVIAAGGIMNKAHMEEMLALGATFVQVGTAFMTAIECEVNDLHKAAILNSEEADTCITKAFTGKPARGLVNKFTEQLKDAPVAPYPLQHHLTTPIRQISGNTNRPEYMSLWMGENSFMAKKESVQTIVEAF